MLIGKPLHYPAAVAERYQHALERLISPMLKEYERELNTLWTELSPEIAQDASLTSQARMRLAKLKAKFDKLFRLSAPTIVDRVLNGVDKHSALSLKESLMKLTGGVTLTTSIMPAALKESMKASTIENVALIKSIQAKYHERIESAVMRSIQRGGEGRKTIIDEIRSIGKVSERRAKLISSDQTRKATAASNKFRSEALGIKKFKWVHSRGGVDQRIKHLNADGNIYSYDDPPKIGDKGEAVLPGEAINCRCVAVPVIEWGQDN